nr:MAG TPA: hypothetical protein [Bacteriophage sp.]
MRGQQLHPPFSFHKCCKRALQKGERFVRFESERSV